MNTNFVFPNLSSLLFFNIEFYFLVILFLLIIFFLGKGLSLQLRTFYTFSFDLFVMTLVRQVLAFFAFVVIVFIFLFVSIFYKRFYFFDFNFFTDSFVVMGKLLALLSTFFVFSFSYDYLRYDSILKSFEYFILLLLALLGLFCLLSANDFLSLYISIEFQSLALYVLAAFKQNSLFSIEGGLKYFILGTFSSGLLLFGISLLYGLTGTLNFVELDAIFQFDLLLKDDYLFKLGLLFFFSSLMFKFSAAPFHMWSPDVYHGAPTILTFFFSLTPKIIFLALFIRILFLFFSPFESYFQFLFFLCGFFSLLLGSLASIYQIKLKRLLAYSSIANVGYILMALSTGQVEGLSASFLFFFFYTFAISGIFSILIGIRYFSNNFELRTIFEFMGLLSFNFVSALIIVLSFFSLLGLPPLSGFIVKFYLFLVSLGSEFFFFLYLSILGSIFSAVIYLRVVRLVLFNKFNNIFFLRPVSCNISLLGGFFILINVIFLFFPTPFFIIVFNVVVNFLKTVFLFNFIF